MLILLTRVVAAIGLIFAVLIAYHHWPDLVSLFVDAADQPVEAGQLEPQIAVMVFLCVVGTAIANSVALVYPYQKIGHLP